MRWIVAEKTYQVEQLGRIELASWMTQQSEPAQLRDDLMVRLRAEAQLGNNQILPELLRHLGLHQEKLSFTKLFTIKILKIAMI